MEVKKLSWRLIVAGIVALIADIIQWLLLPFFIEGAISPVDDMVDFAVGGIMVSLLGFNWVFVPAAVGKLIPFVDMMPFWTGAVFIVALGKEGVLPAMPNAPGQTALPLNTAGTAPVALPAGAAPAQSVPAPAADSQTAKAMNPYFREIEH